MQKEWLWNGFSKTGHNGIKDFEDCLLMDILVRIPRIAIYFMIAGIPFRHTERFPVILFEMIAVVAICSIASLNVLRYIDMSQYIMIMAFTFEIPAILGCILAYFNFWPWVKWVFRHCGSTSYCCDNSNILSHDNKGAQFI